MPAGERELADKVRDDLLASGYPLEIFVGAFLAERGWTCHHSKYYIDRDEGKGREIDILARKVEARVGPFPISHFFGTSASLVVECKKSAKPWVVLTRDLPEVIRNGGRAGVVNWPEKHGSSGWMDDPALRGLILSASEVCWRRGARIGVSLYEASRIGATRDAAGVGQDKGKPSERNPAYEALMAVSKALRYERSQAKPDHHSCGFFVPIIVVDAPLFEARLVEGDMVVEPAAHLTLESKYVSPSYEEGEFFLVDLVTKDAFAAYAERHLDPLAAYLPRITERALEFGLGEMRRG